MSDKSTLEPGEFTRSLGVFGTRVGGVPSKSPKAADTSASKAASVAQNKIPTAKQKQTPRVQPQGVLQVPPRGSRQLHGDDKQIQPTIPRKVVVAKTPPTVATTTAEVEKLKEDTSKPQKFHTSKASTSAPRKQEVPHHMQFQTR